MKLWFLKWLCYWGRIADGIIGVTTLTLVTTDFAMEAARLYSRMKYQEMTL